VIQREEHAELLRLIFDQEDPLYIEIAIQVWVDNKKPHELAAIYGIRPRTISQRLWRMKVRLDALGLAPEQQIMFGG
jgi:hypothetical protein